MSNLQTNPRPVVRRFVFALSLLWLPIFVLAQATATAPPSWWNTWGSVVLGAAYLLLVILTMLLPKDSLLWRFAKALLSGMPRPPPNGSGPTTKG